MKLFLKALQGGHLMSFGREFQSFNALLKDLSRPQFVFDLIDLIVSLERVLWL